MGAEVKVSIDIGSNTVLLLIGRTDGQKVQVVYEEQFAPRLGKEVDAEKNLSEASMKRVMEALQVYKSKIEEYDLSPEVVNVIATSAVRDANNRSEFVNQIKDETGFLVDILSGEEEARLTFLGAKSVLPDEEGAAAVLDIGGGSTELALGENMVLIDRHSFNIGSVRFTERYLKKSPPTNKEIDHCQKAIKEALDQRSFSLSQETKLVGVSGTVTSLAAIELGHQTYQPEKLNGQILSIKLISTWIQTFSQMTAEQMQEKYPEILKGRADVFLAGLLILEDVMRYYNFNDILISTGGIRHGALLQ